LYAEHHQREWTSGDLHVDPLQADGCAQPMELLLTMLCDPQLSL
jgi:hypothetical protein